MAFEYFQNSNITPRHNKAQNKMIKNHIKDLQWKKKIENIHFQKLINYKNTHKSTQNKNIKRLKVHIQRPQIKYINRQQLKLKKYFNDISNTLKYQHFSQ